MKSINHYKDTLDIVIDAKMALHIAIIYRHFDGRVLKIAHQQRYHLPEEYTVRVYNGNEIYDHYITVTIDNEQVLIHDTIQILST